MWFLSRKFPNQKWIRLINTPIILGATGAMPPARSVNYVTWVAVGLFFNFYVYGRYKQWWAKHTYVLSLRNRSKTLRHVTVLEKMLKRSLIKPLHQILW